MPPQKTASRMMMDTPAPAAVGCLSHVIFSAWGRLAPTLTSEARNHLHKILCRPSEFLQIIFILEIVDLRGF